MLILGRKKGERILIGDNIIIELIEGSNVKIGIEAPKDVVIVRPEVLDKQQRKETDGKI